MLVQNLFDFARVDIGAAADDQLLFAIDNLQISLGIENPDVAGCEPTVRAEAARIGVGIVVIAYRDRRTAGQDLARSAGWAVASVIVDHANAHLA